MRVQGHVRRDFSDLHDNYCRCPACKPRLVGEGLLEGKDIAIGLMVAFAIGVIMWVLP